MSSANIEQSCFMLYETASSVIFSGDEMRPIEIVKGSQDVASLLSRYYQGNQVGMVVNKDVLPIKMVEGECIKKNFILYECNNEDGECTKVSGKVDALLTKLPQWAVSAYNSKKVAGKINEGLGAYFDRGIGMTGLMSKLANGGEMSLYDLRKTWQGKEKLDKLLMGDELYEHAKNIQAGNEVEMTSDGCASLKFCFERKLTDKNGYNNSKFIEHVVNFSFKKEQEERILNFNSGNDMLVPSISPKSVSTIFDSLCSVDNVFIMKDRGEMASLAFNVKNKFSLTRFFTRLWHLFFLRKNGELLNRGGTINDNRLEAYIARNGLAVDSGYRLIFDMREHDSMLVLCTLIGIAGVEGVTIDALGANLKSGGTSGIVQVGQNFRLPSQLPTSDNLQRCIWTLSNMTRMQASCVAGYKIALMSIYGKKDWNKMTYNVAEDWFDSRLLRLSAPNRDELSYAPNAGSIKAMIMAHCVSQYMCELVREFSIACFANRYNVKPDKNGVSQVLLEGANLIGKRASWMENEIQHVAGDIHHLFDIQRWVVDNVRTREISDFKGSWASMFFKKCMVGQCSWLYMMKLVVPNDISPDYTRLDGSKDEAVQFKKRILILSIVDMLSNISTVFESFFPNHHVEKFIEYNSTDTNVLEAIGKTLELKLVRLAVTSRYNMLAQIQSAERISMKTGINVNSAEVKEMAEAKIEAALLSKDKSGKVYVEEVVKDVNREQEKFKNEVESAKNTIESVTEQNTVLKALGWKRSQGKINLPRPGPKREFKIEKQQRTLDGNFLTDRGAASRLSMLNVSDAEWADMQVVYKDWGGKVIDVYSPSGDGGRCGINALCYLSGKTESEIVGWMTEHRGVSSWLAVDDIIEYAKTTGLNVTLLHSENISSAGDTTTVSMVPERVGTGLDGVIVHGGVNNMHYYVGKVGKSVDNRHGTLDLTMRRIKTQ